MDRMGFLGYLKKKGLDDEAAERQLAIADHLDTMMSARNAAQGSGCGRRAARSLIEALAQSGEDSIDNILAILRYGYFVGNDEVYVEALMFLDGVEAMDNLYDRLGRIAGEDERDEIFSMVGPISPGTDFKTKAAAMRTVIGEVLSRLDEDKLDELFASSFRDLGDERFSSEAGLLKSLGGVDGYIEAKRSEFIGELRSCMEEGRLFFGQEITPTVIKLVVSDPEMAFGRRDGSGVYVTKIPFRADVAGGEGPSDEEVPVLPLPLGKGIDTLGGGCRTIGVLPLQRGLPQEAVGGGAGAPGKMRGLGICPGRGRQVQVQDTSRGKGLKKVPSNQLHIAYRIHDIE